MVVIDDIDVRFVSQDLVVEIYRLNEVLMDEVVMLNEESISRIEKLKMIENIINMRVVISSVMPKLGIQ